MALDLGLTPALGGARLEREDQMRANGYCVIYLWRGERHRDLQVFSTIKAANEHLALYRADGWRAWVEEY